MQTEGDGESLDVMIENENGESEILWSLQDSWSSEQIWSEGRIELKREEFDDKLYRVNTLKYYASTIRVLHSIKGSYITSFESSGKSFGTSVMD